MVKQKQTHTCRATLAIVLSTNSAGYGSSSGAVRSLTHARVRACKSRVSGGIRGPPETEARMSAMSSMMCRQHLAATNLTGRQFSPLLCIKDAPRDWKPVLSLSRGEMHGCEEDLFVATLNRLAASVCLMALYDLVCHCYMRRRPDHGFHSIVQHHDICRFSQH